MAKQRATLEVCDNPACDTDLREQVVTKEEPATGYHLGKGYWVLGGGGPIPAVFACCEECIVPAINAKAWPDREES